MMNGKSNQDMSYYDVYRVCADMYDEIEEICLADGEPTLLPDLDKLCDLIDEKNWAVWFNTNAIIYSDRMAESLAKNQRSFVAVALDAGTRNTYKKIKRIDTFDKVVENMKKYQDRGCRLFPKYILIPGYNDNIEDMDKFIRIVKEIGAGYVTLSQNLSGFVDGVQHEADPDMPESMFANCTYLIARLQEEGIGWGFQIEFISAHDNERIERLRK